MFKAVNSFGLHALLLQLHSRGEENVQGRASFMGFELDEAAAAEAGVYEEEDEEKASEGSEEAPDTEGGGTDAAETPEGSEDVGAPVRRDDGGSRRARRRQPYQGCSIIWRGARAKRGEQSWHG